MNPPGRIVGFTEPLRNREFRALWAADGQSAIGDQLARVALASLVFARTDSPALTAATYAATFLPALLGSFALGGLADRFDRRSILLATNFARAVLIATITLPGVPLWAALVLVASATVIEPVFSAANSALLPDVFTDPDVYSVASALRLVTHQIAQVLGFAAGGALLAALSPAVELRLDAASFLVAASLVATFVQARPASADPRTERYWAAVRAGVALVARRGDLRTLMLLAWIVGFYVIPEGLAIPYASHINAGPAGLGLLMAANPAGQAIGSAVFKRAFTAERCRRLIGPLAVAAGLPLLVCDASPGLAISCTLWFVSGLATAYMAQTMPEFVLRTPMARRGQAIGVAASGLTAAQGVGILLAGVAASAVPVTTVVALAGLVGAACALSLSLAWRRQLARGPAG